MSRNDEAAGMFAKARQACHSAAVLHALGDFDGACNRAYYAMFGAASAALRTVGQETPRTHGGVIGAFGLAFVKDGPVPKAIGRNLKCAEETRMLADYTGDAIDSEDAQALIQQAQEMISCIQELFFAAKDGEQK